MKYLKQFLTVTAFLSFLSPAIAFAASYPATCPVEAQAIVNAVGGCSAIDPGQYSAIYEKCCSAGTIPDSDPTLEDPTLEDPTLEPSSELSPQSDSETSSDSLAILVLILFFGGLLYLVIWFVRKLKKKKGSAAPIVPEKKCPYCKSVIPGDSKFCSQCRADLRNWLRRHPIWTVIIALILFIFIVGLFS